MAYGDVDKEIGYVAAPESPNIKHSVCSVGCEFLNPRLSSHVGSSFQHVICERISDRIVSLDAQWSTRAANCMIAFWVKNFLTKIPVCLCIQASAHRGWRYDPQAPLQNGCEVIITEMRLLHTRGRRQTFTCVWTACTLQAGARTISCCRHQCVEFAFSDELKHATQ